MKLLQKVTGVAVCPQYSEQRTVMFMLPWARRWLLEQVRVWERMVKERRFARSGIVFASRLQWERTRRLKSVLLMVVDTYFFCLLTEPSGQPSDFLVWRNIQPGVDCNAAAIGSTALWTKGGNFPRRKQLFFISPSCQPHQSFSDWILQWALLPFGPQSSIIRLATELRGWAVLEIWPKIC